MAAVIRSSLISKTSVIFKEFLGYKINKKVLVTNFYSCILCKNFHNSNVLFKRKQSAEEKATEAAGRRVIKYSAKGKIQLRVIDIWKDMTVLEIANALEKDTDHVFEAMEFINNSDCYTKDSSIIDNPQVLKDIVRISGHKSRIVPRPDQRVKKEQEDKDVVRHPPPPIENLQPRPPVVTVMGHVDHGKTTLLDSLRDTRVVDQEFGGITQHIGAFSVKLPGGEPVTFLDTPGHAAFFAMRARGANVTDMVVLVVAADDGVMEQTVESIRMAKQAGVPIIVAINKIDKAGADIESAKRMLVPHGVLVEDLGGDVQAVAVSALKGTNLDLLVEAIVLQAQMMSIKSDPTGPVEGVVIEAFTDPKRGKLATVIVQRGTLKRGCILVAGNAWAKTRVMYSDSGVALTEAPPSSPVQLLGWKELPSAGDEMIQVETEKRAHEVMKWRHNNQMKMKQELDLNIIETKQAEHLTMYKNLLDKKRKMGRFRLRPEGPRQKQFVESEDPELNVVIKGDVDGSVEAILNVLETYDYQEQCNMDIVHFGVGNITENDVEMAEAFNAIIYGFNVECPSKVAELIKEKGVTLKPFNIIYKMVDDIKAELNIRIPITQDEELLGEANVLQNFTLHDGRKKAYVAGCRCIRGVLKRNALYRVIRGRDTIFEGKLNSMRHIKEEVDTIKKDVECGLKLDENAQEFEPGDRIICYEMVDVRHETKWSPPGF